MKPFIYGTLTGLAVLIIFWTGYYFGYKAGNKSWLGGNPISGGYNLEEIKHLNMKTDKTDLTIRNTKKSPNEGNAGGQWGNGPIQRNPSQIEYRW